MGCRPPGFVKVATAISLSAVLCAMATAQPPEPLKLDPPPGTMRKALPLEEALLKARAGNRYAMLLRQIQVEKDAEPGKEIIDQGLRDLREYAGHVDLPRGYWVYVYPYWYIWRDQTATPIARRPWGPEQVTGPPDTTGPGDIQTAWASQTQDEQEEWLLCEFPEPVIPSALLIYETYNPGAVTRVTVFKLDGTEAEVWRGEDPTPADGGHGISVIPFKVDFKVSRVKIYLNSPEVPGWNEIDAVGLRDLGDQTHWASAVEASSTYAQQAVTTPFVPATPADSMLMERMQKLETEVRQLRDSLDEMKRLMRASTEEIKELLKKKQP